jgi:hydrogenase/urease accessory protein HupE
MGKWLVAWAALFSFAPEVADAHMAWTGGGAFWGGFLHPLTSVDEVCFLVALGIWLTFNEPHARLWGVGVVAVVPALAAVIVWWTGREFSTLPGMAALMIVAGLGAAVRLKIPAAPLAAFAGLGAALIGAETGQAASGLSPGGFIIGASLSPLMLAIYLLEGLRRLKAEWQGIACRAIASWIAAIGIMMLTFELWQPHVPFR